MMCRFTFYILTKRTFGSNIKPKDIARDTADTVVRFSYNFEKVSGRNS